LKYGIIGKNIVALKKTGQDRGKTSEQCRDKIVRASKIKVKNVNKNRMATARRLIFLEFLKASIADLITLFFS
jgi:hypothetical protein